MTFGEKGVSQGQFSEYLSTISLNAAAVDWAGEDLTYLHAAVWDADFKAAIAAASPVATLDAFFDAACGGGDAPTDVKYVYGAVSAYPAVAHRFGYLDDEKAGVPRTAYAGTVTFPHNGCRKFAVRG